MKQFERTTLLIGEEKQNILKNANIIVFGIGGVGSYVVEALVRAGIGHLTIVDFDIVDITNINRQIIALNSTIGQKKIEAAKKRILDINPNIELHTYDTFISDETISKFDFTKYNFIIDAIDNVEGKLQIIEKAIKYNIPIISSLGTANKLDPTKLTITDISKTNTCPLARIVRTKLRKKGINHLNVLYSSEIPVKSSSTTLGSISFVPSTAGLLISSFVINNLISKKWSVFASFYFSSFNIVITRFAIFLLASIEKE